MISIGMTAIWPCVVPAVQLTTDPLRYAEISMFLLMVEYLDSPWKGWGESRSFNQETTEESGESVANRSSSASNQSRNRPLQLRWTFRTCTLVDKQPNHRARQSTAAEEPAESPEGKTDLGCDGNTPDSVTTEWSTPAVSKPACHPSSCLGHGLASTRTQPIHSRTQWLTLSPSFNALNMIHGVSLMLCTTFRKRATYVLTTVMQMELQELLFLTT